ncbi:hypothetical protein [Microcoleus sp. herbarium5]|uniref:hypothetical protein n=1 Tax=Microcoleus sp. herbarium5 TaxID=3055434 RepID=UPI002FD74F91
MIFLEKQTIIWKSPRKNLEKNLMTPETGLTTPESAMKELEIEKSQYYARLNKLGIKAKRINGKAFLDEEQMTKLRSYSEPETAIATIDNSSEISLENLPNQEDIPEEKKRDILREAQELYAQQLIMPNMLKAYLAAGMRFDDLSPDLQQTVLASEGAVNFDPKKSAQTIAQSMLRELRAQQPRI